MHDDLIRCSFLAIIRAARSTRYPFTRVTASEAIIIFLPQREQKLQKLDKAMRQRLYIVTKGYHGGFFPWCGHGFCACVKTPFNGEPRLKLKVNDRVLVTRWKE